MGDHPIKVYFVLGEDSGDALGADLYLALHTKAKEAGRDIKISGIAGPRLSALGVRSLFDLEEIAVMGITAVIGRLPTIIRRVHQTVRDVVNTRPDVIVLIDSPDFTHAVAKRVRKKMPGVPIIKYVCPSVWAWRSGRAKTMTAFVDHVLAILPFEPLAMKNLGGPPATYIGHPIAREIAALAPLHEPIQTDPPMLLVLPGSRRSEVDRLLPVFGETLDLLKQRGSKFRAVLPAVPHLKDSIVQKCEELKIDVEVADSSRNHELFAQAYAALAASGTVTLQLALHRVPSATSYILDPVARQLMPFISVWSGLLPNLIADRFVMSEDLNQYASPLRLARRVEVLLKKGPEREAQLQAFEEIIKKMETPVPPGELAAQVIFSHLTKLP